MHILADRPFGTLLSVFVIGSFLGLIVLTLWGVFLAIDSWGRPQHERRGVVTDREFIAAHSTTMVAFNVATKTYLPQSVDHPDDWLVTVALGSHRETVSTPEAFFDSVSIGTTIIAKIVRGRLSKRIYVRTLRVDDDQSANTVTLPINTGKPAIRP